MVSIIIPVYNTEPYIEACLQSVMQQTYDGAMECILVDDCGTDNSITIAQQMIVAYTGTIQFVILHHNQNRGLSAARNTGIAAAKGEYVFLLDSDDEITIDCIEKMMAIAIKDTTIEVVQGRHLSHRKDETSSAYPRIRVTHACSNDEVRRCLFLHFQIPASACNKLMKLSLIKDNHLSFMEGLLYEDIPWTFHWLKYASNVWFIPDVTYLYKKHPGSIVTSTDEKKVAFHRLTAYHEIVTHLTPDHEKEEVEFFAKPFASYYIRHAYNFPEFNPDARMFLSKAWKYKNYDLCEILAICWVFGRFKWGKSIHSIFLRLKQPKRIQDDIQRHFKAKR